MAKKPTIHTDIFEAYRLTGLSPNVKETIRHHIRKIMPEAFQGKKWEEIPQLEKDMFIYMDARDYLMEYVPEIYRKEVSGRVKRKIRDAFLDVTAAIRDHNESVSPEPYFTEGDSEEKKKQAFKRFQKDYLKHFGEETHMEYEAWANQYPDESHSKRASISPFALAVYACEAAEDEEMESMLNPEKASSINRSVNSTLLNTICQIVEQRFHVTIDKKKIRDCLTFLYDYTGNEGFHEWLPRDEKNENDKKYEMYRHMLDHLDFWDAEKSGSYR